MKRLVIVFAVACMMLTACGSFGRPQSADTKESSIEKHLSGEQMEKCVKLLREVEVVKKVASEELVGQMIECRITKKDGSACKVQFLNPYIVIDGVWFKMKEDPQDSFSVFANSIIN